MNKHIQQNLYMFESILQNDTREEFLSKSWHRVYVLFYVITQAPTSDGRKLLVLS